MWWKAFCAYALSSHLFASPWSGMPLELGRRSRSRAPGESMSRCLVHFVRFMSVL